MCEMFACVYSMYVFEYQDEKDQQWKQAMDYLSAVNELNYMTQIVIMLYEDNNKVSLQSCITVQHTCLALLHSFSLTTAVLCISFCLFICVVSRSPPQRSVSMSSFTSVQESKGVKMRRMYLLASASAQPPLRYVNLSLSSRL